MSRLFIFIIFFSIIFTFESNLTEKCYIVNTAFISSSEIQKLTEQFKKHKNTIKFVYKKNILGFSFCSTSSVGKKILKSISDKYSLINIEEDKIFKVNYRRSANIKHTNHNLNSTFKEVRKKNEQNTVIQTNIPPYFIKMINTGNLIFNNYLLDLPIIRYFNKYFYKYEYKYDGKGINIKVLTTPECNNIRSVHEILLNNTEYTLSKGSIVEFIDSIGCSGSIKLSELLFVLEKIENINILILPIFGPYSEALNTALKKISQTATVVTSAGDDGVDGCNTSPSGNYIIKVGSATKHGQVSNFSNWGNCVNVYSLGEDILEENGTGISAVIVGSAIAVFKETEPDSSYFDILKFLNENSVKNEYNQPIFKIPNLLEHRTLIYYSLSSVLIFHITVISIIVFILFRLYRKIRTKKADDQNFVVSLRPKIKNDLNES